MAGAFTTLAAASHAMQAQQAGLEITGQNMANLNTPGYTRRSVNLVEVPLSEGGGVNVAGILSARDAFVDLRLRTELSAQARDSAVDDSLSVVQTSLGSAGSSIDGSLSAFFDAFSALAADPQSAVVRDGALLQGRQVALAFNDMAARLADSRASADAQVQGAVSKVNELTTRIATLNAQIGSASGSDVQGLKDAQNLALQDLAKLTPVTVMANADGGVDVTLASGLALVVGANQYGLETQTRSDGLAAIIGGGNHTDITDALSQSGQIGGLLHVRDTLLPDYQKKLDDLAAAFATRVNAAHSAGYDTSGRTGTNFFAPAPAGGVGAAAALALDPAILADPTRLAASSSATAAGDNGAAKAIAALRDTPTVGTSTFGEAWSQIVYTVGTDAQTNKNDLRSRQDVVAAIQQLRDSVSGVSLDEEAGKMLQFQRAYQANAKLFTTINQTLDTLMAMIGVS